MAEPTDAVLPILQKMQSDIAAGFKKVDGRFAALEAKVNDLSEHVLDIKSDISEIRKDNLVHLDLTAKHRLDFEDLREDMTDVKRRLEMLEGRLKP